MKLFARNTSKSSNVIKLAALGLVLLIVATVTFVYDPLELIVESQLTLRTGSLLYDLWLKPPVEVFITVYLFNVTNQEAFASGSDDKLKVVEVGPYVYQETLEIHNITFNANNTVTYSPRRKVRFVRERSVGDPKVDRIVAPNIPYMGVTSIASSFSTFAALAVSALTRKFKSKAMLEISVHKYLWGYEDQLVYLASKIIPNVIDFQRFGLMERMFNEGDNLVTMQLPAKPARDGAEAEPAFNRDFSILSWNGERDIRFWKTRRDENSTNCNSLFGSYDATLFPRKITKGETFRIYRKAFCRTLPIAFSHPGTVGGIDGYYFKLNDKAFDSDLHDKDSSCFCKNRKCLKRGLGNIGPCYYNIPLAISFPHFLNADPSLLAPLEGLHPNQSKHGTDIVIQPQLGIPMRLHTRFQVNLLLEEVKYNRDMSRFRNMVLPIFWLEIGVENLRPGVVVLLKLLFKVCPYVQYGVIVALVIAGVSLVGTALLLRFWMPTAPLNALKTVNNTLERTTKRADTSIVPLLHPHQPSPGLAKGEPLDKQKPGKSRALLMSA